VKILKSYELNNFLASFKGEVWAMTGVGVVYIWQNTDQVLKNWMVITTGDLPGLKLSSLRSMNVLVHNLRQNLRQNVR